MTALPFRIESNNHACDGELWGQPCGRKRETENWVAWRNCPAYRLWNHDKPSGLAPEHWWSTASSPTIQKRFKRSCPPGVDHERWVDGHPLNVGDEGHYSLKPPAVDHSRWWRHNETGTLLYTSEPYTPIDSWRESPEDYAKRVFDCLGLHVAYGRRGHGHYAAESRIESGHPVPSMMIAVSMDRDLAHAAAACECIPFDFDGCKGLSRAH